MVCVPGKINNWNMFLNVGNLTGGADVVYIQNVVLLRAGYG